MPYNLSELRAFLSVVEEGSIGRSAEKLGITQPALSRIIKRLEADVGEPLFERHTGGMRLSSYGEALLPHAQLLHQEELLARNEINRMRGLASGLLRLGITSGASALFVHKAIGAFLEKWPDTVIEAVEDIWDELASALVNYRIDLVLAPQMPETEAIVEVNDCRWYEVISPVVGVHHPLRTRSAVRMEDLLGERWCLIPQNTEPHSRFRSLFRNRGLSPPRISLTSSSIPLLKSLVAHCGFITWLTRPMYAVEMNAGLIFELDVDGLSHERCFGAYHRRVGVLPAAAVHFLREVRTVVDSRHVP